MKNEGRNSVKVMLGLLGMVWPLFFIMLIAIGLGCIGNLMASFLTIFGGYALLSGFDMYLDMAQNSILGWMCFFAVFRGIFRYGEQAANHYIAFRILARIRHQVFAAFRKLAPAKLDGAEKGNLISIITSDIELLEVFYAHTISPILIAIVTSAVMCIFIGEKHRILGVTAAVFYLLVGAVVPMVNSKLGSGQGSLYRCAFGKLNTTVLDNLYGMEEILQYQKAQARKEQMQAQSETMEEMNQKLKDYESIQRISTEGIILVAGTVMTVLAGHLTGRGEMEMYEGVIAVIAMMSSFGPVAALSALSNNLNLTLASGNRVLDLLKEQPIVKDITHEKDTCDGDILCENLAFRYGDETKPFVLQDLKARFTKNRIHGIFGKSGCGKSTLLKLLIRFYETDSGKICYGEHGIEEINTTALRSHVSYVTQDTFLFQDTIENNIKIGNANASREMVETAAKKASIHNFISSLPNGYDTKLAELGESVSGGERQRIGIARAFLHDSAVILLDEPTSNVDSLNEGLILKSLKEEKDDRTILLVSHRRSALSISDDVLAI